MLKPYNLKFEIQDRRKPLIVRKFKDSEERELTFSDLFEIAVLLQLIETAQCLYMCTNHLQNKTIQQNQLKHDSSKQWSDVADMSKSLILV